MIESNDSDPDGDAITVSAFDATSTAGGTVAVAADGSFTYDPPAGFTGVDTFTYTITDGFLTDTATVSMTVADMVWFVDEDATVAGDGRLSSPFDTLANFLAAAVDGTGDYIYLHSSATDYVGNLVLKDDQQLIGGGVALTVGTTPILPAAARPTLVEAGVGFTLTTGANNTIGGLDLGSSNGQALLASAAGTCTISDLDVSSTSGGGGIAVNFSGGTFNAVFGAITVGGGGTGLNLSNGSTGTVQVLGTMATIGTSTGVFCDAGSLPTLVFNDLTLSGGSRGISMGASTAGSLSVTGTLTISAPTQDGVEISGATIPVTFEVLALSDCGEHGIDRISHAGTLMCLGGLIDDTVLTGIHCLGCSGALVLDSVTIQETGDGAPLNGPAHGVLIDDCTGNITINLCTLNDMFDSNPGVGADNNGIQIDCADGGTIASVQITDCTFVGTEVAAQGTTTDHGIRIALEGGSDITDCDITDCLGYDLSADSSRSCWTLTTAGMPATSMT